MYIFKKLVEYNKKVELIIVGDGAEKGNLQTLAIYLGINDYVRFTGFIQPYNIPKFLASSDFFLFPSEYDIWGLVLVEAMLAGMCCFSSIYAGATDDLIVEGETGFAVDFNDTDKVIEKINWILDNPDKAQKIGENAAQFIKENVSLKNSVNGFLEALELV